MSSKRPPRPRRSSKRKPTRAKHAHWIGCLLLIAALLPSGCSHEAQHAPVLSGGTPIARVLLLQNLSIVVVTCSEQPTIRLLGNHTVRRVDVAPGVPVALTLTSAGWQFGGAPLGSGELQLTPAIDGSVAINKTAYRGRYRFVPHGPGTFDVINDVDIEGYLKSVVSKEMLRQWKQLEAFKAQAVVARTYALWKMKNASPASLFDLYDDQRDQVYGGIDAESALSQEAVDATTGVVVAAGRPGDEKIFKAYFSSCCGGISQSASDAFGDPPSPQLTAINVGTLCAASPNFSWAPIVVTKAELTTRLRKFGQIHDRAEKGMGPVVNVEIAARNVFGRPVRFAVTDAAGHRYIYRDEDFRAAANTDCAPGHRLLSSFFTPVCDAKTVAFTNGHGSGHGVGLCQYCTEARAEQGENYDQIVTSAYPQSRLFKVYER
jgi:SpoIID/LytB domain protein